MTIFRGMKSSVIGQQSSILHLCVEEEKRAQKYNLGAGGTHLIHKKEITNGKYHRSETICSGKLFSIPKALCNFISIYLSRMV